jgi:CheY-like chemotaxis protein
MKRTVLIVEDDEPTQLLLQAVMRRSGLTAVLAPNGQAAIDLIDTRSDFGCIILDLMMPEVDGRAVIAHLAAVQKRIPVIVCSAGLPKSPVAFDPEIVRAVLRKPFDIDQLISTLAEILGSSGQPLP